MNDDRLSPHTGPIHQGDLFWAPPEETGEHASTYPHPCVVIQDDVFNASRIHTVVVCALTTNLNRASEPGNVLLDPSEGNLDKQSVIVVAQVSSLEKTRLGQRIGSLSRERVEQVLAGMRFQQASYFRQE